MSVPFIHKPAIHNFGINLNDKVEFIYTVPFSIAGVTFTVAAVLKSDKTIGLPVTLVPDDPKLYVVFDATGENAAQGTYIWSLRATSDDLPDTWIEGEIVVSEKAQ